MGKVKKEKKIDTTKYEDDNEGESSGDEMPEVVSNKAMKNDQEQILKELEYLKQQLRKDEKAKRRMKQDLFITQKKVKLDKAATIAEEDYKPQPPASDVPVDKPKPVKKVYKSLNITVEPLNKVGDSRASSALDFKSRRLAKAPRESVKSAVISYQKKLQARR